MRHPSLSRHLQANQTYYARLFAPLSASREQIR
jgi:hypothetical protein